MILDGKNQHCENDYTTQSNLQIQCNPYQTTNGTLHRTRTKNFTICMETQKTPNSQSKLEKEKRSWRNQTPQIPTIPQATVIKTLGIKTQTYQRMDLGMWGGGGVGCGRVRECHGHIYTTKCRVDSQWGAAARRREISSVLCDHLEGWDGEGGREGDAREKRNGNILYMYN